MTAHLTEAEKAETEAFVAKYLADKEVNKVSVDQRSIDHVLSDLARLRASHAELLAAAKEVLAAVEPMAWDFPRLQAAIANAEKEAP